jgi:hypothetical protein
MLAAPRRGTYRQDERRGGACFEPERSVDWLRAVQIRGFDDDQAGKNSGRQSAR